MVSAIDRWCNSTLAVLLCAVAACAAPSYSTGAGPADTLANTCSDGGGPVPEAIADQYALDTRYYARYCHAWGVPVLGSAQLDPRVLAEAGRLTSALLEARQDIRDALHDRYLRVVVLASSRGERFQDVPELKDTGAREAAAAGLGPTPDFPAVTVRDSVVVCRPTNDSPNVSPPGETLIHELGHAVLEMNGGALANDFKGRLKQAFSRAQSQQTWLLDIPTNVGAYFGTDLPTENYLMTNRAEYWAVGTASYFGFKPIRIGYGTRRNQPNQLQLTHLQIQGPEALSAQDPALTALLAEAYPGPPVAEHLCPEWLAAEWPPE